MLFRKNNWHLLQIVFVTAFSWYFNFFTLKTSGCVVPGAAAFEIKAHRSLKKFEENVKGRARLGLQAFADALLIIAKVLATNSGHDPQETIVKLLEESAQVEGRKGSAKELVGLDLATGEVIQPYEAGILDNYNVKKQMISSAYVYI